MLAQIVRVHGSRELARGLYGSRKVFHQLKREGGVDGSHVPKCQVERLMKAAGLQGVSRGRVFKTTRPDPTSARPADLVNRHFAAERPNKLWLVDFTYVPTWSGMSFTAFVFDACSQRIVGWRTADAMPTELPLDALEMALWNRSRAGEDITGVVHHSDAGSQYTSIRYTSRLLDAGAVASIGSVGDSYDNALAESLIGLYKAECVRPDGPWRGVDDLEFATLNWVHWFNEVRLHSTLGYVPPVEYEAQFITTIDPRQQDAAGRTQPPLKLGTVQ